MSNPTILNLLDVLTNDVNWAGDWNFDMTQLKALFKTFNVALSIVGDPVTPYNATIQLQDAEGNNVNQYCVVRVRVTDWSGYLPSATRTIAAGSGTTLLDTKASGTDLVLKSNSSGLINVTVNNPTYGGFKLLLAPDIYPQFANYNNPLVFNGFPLLNMAGAPIFNMAGLALYHA